jgi:hypothetical protein
MRRTYLGCYEQKSSNQIPTFPLRTVSSSVKQFQPLAYDHPLTESNRQPLLISVRVPRLNDTLLQHLAFGKECAHQISC